MTVDTVSQQKALAPQQGGKGLSVDTADIDLRECFLPSFNSGLSTASQKECPVSSDRVSVNSLRDWRKLFYGRTQKISVAVKAYHQERGQGSSANGDTDPIIALHEVAALGKKYNLTPKVGPEAIPSVTERHQVLTRDSLDVRDGKFRVMTKALEKALIDLDARHNPESKSTFTVAFGENRVTFHKVYVQNCVQWAVLKSDTDHLPKIFGGVIFRKGTAIEQSEAYPDFVRQVEVEFGKDFRASINFSKRVANALIRREIPSVRVLRERMQEVEPLLEGLGFSDFHVTQLSLDMILDKSGRKAQSLKNYVASRIEKTRKQLADALGRAPEPNELGQKLHHTLVTEKYGENKSYTDQQVRNLEMALNVCANEGVPQEHAPLVLDLLASLMEVSSCGDTSPEASFLDSYTQGASTAIARHQGGLRPAGREIIRGTAQGTGTPGHRFASYRIALKMARSGEYSEIFLDTSFRHALKTSTVLNRPDILGVRYDGRVDVVEVQSRTDRTQDLYLRNLESLSELPKEQIGSIRIIQASKLFA